MKLNHFKWQRWHYKNTTLLILSLILFFLLAKTPQVENFIKQVGILGLSKIKRWQFFLVSLVLNASGIFIVVSAARMF